jgi:selenocysteine lyase/cysteine desulfurase
MALSKRLQDLNPGIVGWRSHKDMWDFRADRLELPNSAKRFEFGTMAYGIALATTESLDFLLGQTIENIADHNRDISQHLLEGLIDLGAALSSPSDFEQRSAIVAARFPGHESRNLVAAMKQRDVVASLRGDYIRFAPHLYNNSDDIDSALATLRSLTA